MLCRLTVENYALIDRLDIEFAAGLNIITGETGAGKSILLGALGLVLGARADAAAIKDSGRNCVVEAEFDVRGYGLEPLFGSLDVDYDERTVVRRVITPAGKSRAYVNDLPVQLTALREIGVRLIDIHSQHQTLLLGDSRFRTGLLDSVGEAGDRPGEYRRIYGELRRCESELETLRARAEQSGRDREYVSFQLNELREAKLSENEQQELEAGLSELSHASEIRDTLLFAASELEGAEDSLLSRLKSVATSVGRIAEVYPRAEEFYARLHVAALDLKDLASEAASGADRIDADPRRLEQVTARLDRIYSLQQKHRVASVSELLALQARYEAQLADIEGGAEAIAQMRQQVERLRAEAVRIAGELTAVRTAAAPRIEEQIAGMLAELGMESAVLRIEIAPAAELRPDGADTIRFLFTANRRMPLQPVEKVASGGEMSRLMLSLKSLVARSGQLPTVIFDEIDTGVSGSVADRMGEIIVRLSSGLQVINITHLPQVAAKGSDHFFVYKEESASGTATRIRKLAPSERVEQIARMLSGTDVTEAAREQARLLLGDRAC